MHILNQCSAAAPGAGKIPKVHALLLTLVNLTPPSRSTFASGWIRSGQPLATLQLRIWWSQFHSHPLLTPSPHCPPSPQSLTPQLLFWLTHNRPACCCALLSTWQMLYATVHNAPPHVHFQLHRWHAVLYTQGAGWVQTLKWWVQS